MKQTVKILSIDDDADIRYALKAIFDYQGWEGILAGDVEEGVALFRKHQPDLVLMDYHLPRISGIEGVRLIRMLSPTVPIVVFTIEESQEVANRFLDAGATDFALKPIKAPDLISRIRLHISILEDREKHAQNKQPEAKGIGLPTLGLITNYLREQSGYLTAEQIAEGTGLAYQTAYRYLQYMVSQQSLDVHSTYGKVGRPKQGYKLKER